MIGILIIAHDSLGDGLAHAVTHVLGSRPPQFEVLSVAATDDPLMLLPAARQLIARLDTGAGVLVFSDIYGASPCNLVGKLLEPGRVEGVAGRHRTVQALELSAHLGKRVLEACDLGFDAPRGNRVVGDFERRVRNELRPPNGDPARDTDPV